MKDSFKNKLVTLSHRFQELSAMLSDVAIIQNQNKFRDLSREYAQLEGIVRCFERYQHNDASKASAEKMLSESDSELQALAQEELSALKTAQASLEEQL